jgi:hypothetical protein
VTVTKTGVFAGQIRSSYRFLSPGERKKSLQKVLVEGYPDVIVDTLVFDALDTLSDTVRYHYRYRAKNAANISLNTAIVALNIPDQITGGSFPSEETRHYDVDMGHSWYDVGTYRTEGELALPAGWKPITVPAKVNLSSAYGAYALEFSWKNGVMTFCREALFNFRGPIAVSRCGEVKKFMSAVAKADNIQLMFYTNGSQ